MRIEKNLLKTNLLQILWVYHINVKKQSDKYVKCSKKVCRELILYRLHILYLRNSKSVFNMVTNRYYENELNFSL